MIRFITFLLAMTVITINCGAIYAQNDIPIDDLNREGKALDRCGTLPPFPEDAKRVHEAIRALQESRGERSAIETLLIPVAIHVVRNDDGSADVTDDQIDAQMEVLNDSFADFGFQFTLASVDRTNNSTWSKGAYDSFSAASQMKQALAVDPATTLNIYICDMSYPLGYAYLPNYFPEDSYMHGVVVVYTSLPGSPSSYYNEGDTVTHEVGHYLGLYHTFQSGCYEPGDYVDDTPYQATSTSGCPAGKDTCPLDPGEDPIYNFMDYSDDSCMDTFTQGQAERMKSMVELYKPSLLSGGGVEPSDCCDLNGDGKISRRDMRSFFRLCNSANTEEPAGEESECCDRNGDGKINLRDLILWNRECSSVPLF